MEGMTWEDLKINHIYQHTHSKKLCKVLNFARDLETKDIMVIFVALQPNYQTYTCSWITFMEQHELYNETND